MVGIDIVTIARIEKMFNKFGQRAYERFLCPKEILLVKNPTTASGFWAAKEAASKAIGTGIGAQCGFHDIKISKTKRGAPKLKYSKQVRKRFKIKKSYVSITHDGGFAIAVVNNIKKKKK